MLIVVSVKIHYRRRSKGYQNQIYKRTCDFLLNFRAEWVDSLILPIPKHVDFETLKSKGHGTKSTLFGYEVV